MVPLKAMEAGYTPQKYSSGMFNLTRDINTGVGNKSFFVGFMMNLCFPENFVMSPSNKRGAKTSCGSRAYNMSTFQS